MKFPDKHDPFGQTEVYSDGEPTERFVVLADTKLEADALRAALTSVAMTVMRSEDVKLEEEDAKLLLNVLSLGQYEQSRLVVTEDQAERLAGLVEQGAASAKPDMLKNQFNTRDDSRIDKIPEIELGETALEIAEATRIEVQARKFGRALNGDLSKLFDADQ